MKGCNEIDIVAYCENSLSADKRRLTEAHISNCSICLDTISDFQRARRVIVKNIKDTSAPDMREVVLSRVSTVIRLPFLRPSWALSLALHLTVFAALTFFFVSINEDSSQDKTIPVVNTAARKPKPVKDFYFNRQYDNEFFSENIRDKADYIASIQNSDGSWNGNDMIHATSLNLLILYAFNRDDIYHKNLFSGSGYLVTEQDSDGTFSDDPLVNSMASTFIILQYIYTNNKGLERSINALSVYYQNKNIVTSDAIFPLMIQTLYNEVFFQRQIIQINIRSNKPSPLRNAIVKYFTKGEINIDVSLSGENGLYDKFYYMFHLYNVSSSDFNSVARVMRTEKYDIQTLEGKIMMLTMGIPYLFPRM